MVHLNLENSNQEIVNVSGHPNCPAVGVDKVWHVHSSPACSVTLSFTGSNFTTLICPWIFRQDSQFDYFPVISKEFSLTTKFSELWIEHACFDHANPGRGYILELTSRCEPSGKTNTIQLKIKKNIHAILS